MRTSPIRPRAAAATGNGLLASEPAAGIARVKSAKSIGDRSIAPERAGHLDAEGPA